MLTFCCCLPPIKISGYAPASGNPICTCSEWYSRSCIS